MINSIAALKALARVTGLSRILASHQPSGIESFRGLIANTSFRSSENACTLLDEAMAIEAATLEQLLHVLQLADR
jgi:hypothetical protein